MAIFGIFSILGAREDPFTPVVVPKDSIRPYYGETSVFDMAQIEFPSSARLIKKIEVTFQNIDGSIQTRSVAARGRIDWRMPLLISQVLNKNQIARVRNIDNKTPPTSPKPAKTMVKAVDIPIKESPKPPTKTSEAIETPKLPIESKESQEVIADSLTIKSQESTIKSKETIVRESEDSAREMRISGNTIANSNKMVDSKNTPKIAFTPQSKPQVQILSKPRQVDSTSSVTKNPHPKKVPYIVNGNSIFISYVGTLKRHYIMQNPYRIVMDFTINKNFYKRNSYRIDEPYFKRLRYGLHETFLRIVLELDGNYVYTLEKHSDGVRIDVK